MTEVSCSKPACARELHESRFGLIGLAAAVHGFQSQFRQCLSPRSNRLATTRPGMRNVRQFTPVRPRRLANDAPPIGERAATRGCRGRWRCARRHKRPFSARAPASRTGRTAGTSARLAVRPSYSRFSRAASQCRIGATKAVPDKERRNRYASCLVLSRTLSGAARIRSRETGASKRGFGAYDESQLPDGRI